jgi:uncharacterized protein (DUF362 family)
VIDGFTGMEGNGPEKGDAVDLGIALAGTDYVAVDSLAARIMGFDPADIGYLAFCEEAGMGISDPERIELRGGNWRDFAKNFRPHENIARQLAWKKKDLSRFYIKEPVRPS